MAIDGLIVLDATGRPVIQTGFRSSPTAYPLVHIDAVNNALAKAARIADVDPVLYVPAQGLDGPTACCHVETGGMRFLCPVSGDLDPLYALAFLQTFIDILTEYFGTVSPVNLRENFDIVYQLLEETLDTIGHPLTTSPNALRDIVLPPSLLSKVLSVAGAGGLSAASAQANPFASPIPWRKANVKHANNEIYFDIMEEMLAVVNKSGTPIISDVYGKIDSNSKLSGTPDLLLNFTNAQKLADYSFHPCVRLPRWVRDKSLSFVPPDGRFTLMEYRVATSSTSTAVAAAAPVPLPFALRASVRLDDTGGSLDLTLTNRLPGRTLDSIAVELYLGTTATGASLQSSGTNSWSYDPRRQAIRWEISALGTGASPTLRGTFASSGYPRPARAFRITFSIPQHSFSSLKVDQLRLTGEQYKPYKGVRARAGGDVEWRW